jgi:hypothetical protein
MNAPRWSTTGGCAGCRARRPPVGLGHGGQSSALCAPGHRPSFWLGGPVGCPLHARASVVVLAGWSVGCAGRRVSGVVRRPPSRTRAGEGRRASVAGRRASAALPARTREKGVGCRASGVGRSGFLKCFYEFFYFLLIYTLHFVIPSIK